MRKVPLTGVSRPRARGRTYPDRVGLPAHGARRRDRRTPPRDSVIRVKVTPGERAVIAGAADRAGLSVGAWIADACIAAAEHRAGDVDDVLREMLRELLRVSGLIQKAGTNLNQAVARLNATGQPGPDLAPAADWLTRVAGHVDDASLAISTRLPSHLRRRKRP